ncbi:alpha/beta hydrolase [Candidatus Fermentibacteria bacterium]|nr:alpha/beta hydrolase [Candidatus Fermentibacteria bacterium]
MDDGILIRRHGSSGPVVIALHGGPAAAGSAAPIARGLSGAFRVLEPWQRASSAEPLTVARHVADLHEVVLTADSGVAPALVGESWGAMLALAYAAAHPAHAGPLVLVGCGTFDTAARARIGEILEERTDDALRQRLQELSREFSDPWERLAKRYELIRHLYSYDPIEEDADDVPPLDVTAHRETWDDMLRLQKEGVYPAAFAAITSPVIMLHGAYDPHPGQMIRDSLVPYIPQIEYQEWERCGHHPWKERAIREEFFSTLGDWLMRNTQGPHSTSPDPAAP